MALARPALLLRERSDFWGVDLGVSGVMSEDEPERDAPVGRRLEALRAGLTAWFRRRTGDSVEAQDLVQDSFVRILQRDAADLPEYLEGYVYRTAANILTDRHRRRATRRAADHVSTSLVEVPANDLSPHDALETREALDRVTRLLEALPERTRTIFVLRRLEGLRHKEIAVRLGISVSSVEKHLVRAIAALSEGDA